MKSRRETYLSMLGKWLVSSEPYLSTLPGNPASLVYGTGYNSWGVQTQQKAFATFAICSALLKDGETLAGKSRDELLDMAVRLLRFNLNSHVEGDSTCTDGSKWGHTWISALGIERMMAGIDMIHGQLPAELQGLLRKVLISEADWLLQEHPIVASPDDPGKNKPESNLWNGALLHRVAMLYPDCPNAAAYREKGSAFLLNSISVPSDRDSAQIIAGKKLSEWHIDANFQETYALVHHGYMNVGYMVICLSQVALLHFSYRERGIAAPKELYHHALDLWKLVKQFTFPDGRLLRIGGDTRVRYCYCQDYAMSVWMLMADHFADPDALRFEQAWLKSVQLEQNLNADGSFLGSRLSRLKEVSPLYYTRLESDRAVSLAQSALWLERFAISEKLPLSSPASRSDFAWYDSFHGALFLRNAENIRSWVWMAARVPFGLCLPLNDSSLAEWDFNCSGQIQGTGMATMVQLGKHQHQLFKDSFVTIGKYAIVSAAQLGEGQKDDTVAETQIACAALPDGKSMLIMQYSKAPARVYVRSLKGLMLQLPNDLFNDFHRSIRTPAETIELNGLEPPYGLRDLNSKILNIDNKLTIELFYGADSLKINRPAERQIVIRYKDAGGGNLYCEEICSKCISGLQKYEADEVLLDECFAVQVGTLPPKTGFLENAGPTCSEECRYAAFAAADGKNYALAANFGAQEGSIEFHEKITLIEEEKDWSGTHLQLPAGTCKLFMIG